jgi:hypothetical protein
MYVAIRLEFCRHFQTARIDMHPTRSLNHSNDGCIRNTSVESRGKVALEFALGLFRAFNFDICNLRIQRQQGVFEGFSATYSNNPVLEIFNAKIFLLCTIKWLHFIKFIMVFF